MCHCGGGYAHLRTSVWRRCMWRHWDPCKSLKERQRTIYLDECRAVQIASFQTMLALVREKRMAVFHMRSRSSVGSCAFMVTGFWYVPASVPRLFSVWIRIGTLPTVDTSGVIFALRMRIMLWYLVLLQQSSLCH